MSIDAPPALEIPLRDRGQLLATFQGAARPTGPWLIGLEHEKFLFRRGTLAPAPYEGNSGLAALFERFGSDGWTLIRDPDTQAVIAASLGRAMLSIEPGGQFEFSGSPHPSASAAHRENAAHHAVLEQHARQLGLDVACLGYRPEGTVDDVPWMPKTRYTAMRQTLRGSMAQAMMKMTCTAQVSVDWSGEAQCAEKVTAAARATPILVALFANSRLVEGRDSGYASFRSRVWNDVDAARCGFPPFLLDGTFTYEQYVDWALSAPMLFLRRAGRYLVPNVTFRQFMESGFESHVANEQDWEDHLSTLFPEVRIKKVLEVRAADSREPEFVGALAGLVRGLLEDTESRKGLLALLPRLPLAAFLTWHRDVQKNGLQASLQGRSTGAWAEDVAALAEAGLRRLGDDPSLLLPLRPDAEIS